MRSQYKKAVDSNQASIIRDLRLSGVQVIVTSSMGKDFLDLLLAKDSAWSLVEVKTLDGSLYRGQLEFLANAKGLVGVATDYETARSIAEYPHKGALTDKQKQRITVWLWQNPTQESLRIRKFYGVINGKS